MRGAMVTLVALVLTGVASNSASGGTIDFVGLADDAGASGPATFGTDGWDLYSTSPVGSFTQTHNYTNPFGAGTRLQSLPTYISGVTANGANHSAAGYLYATINNPATGAPVQSGLAFRFDSINTEKSLLDINLGSSVPPVFYVGIMTDTSLVPAVPSDTFDAVRMRISGGADSGLITAMGDVNSGVDFYFFKVAGANPGDIITVSGVEAEPNWSSGLYHLETSGLTFSQTNPVPEPSSFALLGVGAIGLLAFVLRRRRRKHLAYLSGTSLCIL
jgi:hypothetical protein